MSSYTVIVEMEGSGAEVVVGACAESTFLVFGFEARVPVAELEVGQTIRFPHGPGQITDIQVS
jgi:hypothetical protein